MSTPQTIQNQFVQNQTQQDPRAQGPTLPQTFTASAACVREKKNVATNVTIFSLCEQEKQIDDMLNCEEAERAFATLRKKMERDARQKKENSEITLITLFNNTYFACSIKVKKHFYAKHIYTIQTVGLLTIIYLAMLTIIYIAMLLFCY